MQNGYKKKKTREIPKKQKKEKKKPPLPARQLQRKTFKIMPDRAGRVTPKKQQKENKHNVEPVLVAPPKTGSFEE